MAVNRICEVQYLSMTYLLKLRWITNQRANHTTLLLLVFDCKENLAAAGFQVFPFLFTYFPLRQLNFRNSLTPSLRIRRPCHLVQVEADQLNAFIILLFARLHVVFEYSGFAMRIHFHRPYQKLYSFKSFILTTRICSVFPVSFSCVLWFMYHSIPLHQLARTKK